MNCKGLWAKCADNAMHMENAAMKSKKEPPFWQFFKKDPPFITSLQQTSGEIGIHDAKKIHGKLENHGKISMFIGYAADHASNTFKMLNLETKRIWQSQEVCWIASSLPAYAALQLAHMKASKNDDDFDDELTIKSQFVAAAPNPIPAVKMIQMTMSLQAMKMPMIHHMMMKRMMKKQMPLTATVPQLPKI